MRLQTPCQCKKTALGRSQPHHARSRQARTTVATCEARHAPQYGQLPGLSDQSLLQPPITQPANLLQTAQPMYRQAAMKVRQLPSEQPHLRVIYPSTKVHVASLQHHHSPSSRRLAQQCSVPRYIVHSTFPATETTETLTADNPGPA